MQAQSLASMRDDALALLVDDGTLVRLRCIFCAREWFVSPEMTGPRDEWLCARCAKSDRPMRYGEDVPSPCACSEI